MVAFGKRSLGFAAYCSCLLKKSRAVGCYGAGKRARVCVGSVGLQWWLRVEQGEREIEQERESEREIEREIGERPFHVWCVVYVLS